MNASHRTRATLAAAGLALLLAGCGNKGPLIQPPIPLQEADGTSAAAVDAGAVADPPPADESASPVPPAMDTTQPQTQPPPRSGDPRR